MKELKFFAYDRASPRILSHSSPHGNGPALSLQASSGTLTPSLPDISEITNTAVHDLYEIGTKCEKLREAVAIRHDVSEGCEGWFVKFEDGEMEFEDRTVVDFLIGWERWTVV